MEKYEISYNNGVVHEVEVESLEKAKKRAIEHLTCTRKDITILKNGEPIIISRYRILRVYENDNILRDFGNQGFYTDWISYSKYKEELADEENYKETLEKDFNSQTRYKIKGYYQKQYSAIFENGERDDFYVSNDKMAKMYVRFYLSAKENSVTLYKADGTFVGFSKFVKGKETSPKNAAAYNSSGHFLEWSEKQGNK